jgi:hypothetical protein
MAFDGDEGGQVGIGGVWCDECGVVNPGVAA